jgi:hypothetical protein
MSEYRIEIANEYITICEWINDRAAEGFDLQFFTQSEDSEYIHYTAVMEKPNGTV